MTDSKLELLRAQTHRYLSAQEAQSLKRALSQFTQEKSVRNLVTSMSILLDTVKKQRIFSTIGHIIPNHYREEYYMLQEPCRLYVSPEDQVAMQKEEELYILERAEVRRQAERALHDDAEKQRLREEGRRHLQAIKKESLSMDSMKLADSSLNQDSQDYDISPEVIAAIKDDDGPDTKTAMWKEECLFAECHSREDAETILVQSGALPGSFFLRHIDPKTEAMKTTKVMPFRSFMLSMISRGKPVHILVEQQESTLPFTVDGRPLGSFTEIGNLIDFLKTVPEFMLTHTPYHCQPWYHGNITKQAAEQSLARDPTNGRFLVRHAPSEPGIFELSIFFNTGFRHEKIFFKESQWIAACAPLRPHRSLTDLLLFHAGDAGGLPCRLARPCLRVRGQGVTAISYVDPPSGTQQNLADGVHAESDVQLSFSLFAFMFVEHSIRRIYRNIQKYLEIFRV